MDTLQTMPEPTEERNHRPVVEVSGELLADPSSQEPPQRQPRLRRTVTIAAGLIALSTLGYWQIGSIRNLFRNLLPYAPTVFPSVIALCAIIFKDWKNYKPRWFAWVLMLIVVAAGVIGVATLHVLQPNPFAN